MTQDQTNGREPVPSFTPISATKVDNPKQTEFRLVSPAPAQTEPGTDPAAASPATPVPAVPSQSRRGAAGEIPDSAADTNPNPVVDTAPDRAVDTPADSSATVNNAADRGGRLAEGEELIPGADDDEPLPFSADDHQPPADARADEELLPSGADDDEPLTHGGPDDEPLLAGVEELRAGWQRVRIAFVDNPRGAVAEAAGLTDEAAEALAAALREQRHRIRTSWDGNGSGRDTEALRLALLRYQALFSKIVGGLAHGARVGCFHFR
jgi:hypothetical protein